MVGWRLFALDCVTFKADTGKINPALWTDRAGDTGPFILAWTASHLATGPTVKKGGRTEEKQSWGESERRGHTGHTHSYTSCLLISLKPGIFERKQMTMDACRLEDWFTNELFEEIAEDSWIFFIGIWEEENRRKMENKHHVSTGQIPDERWHTERKAPDKTTNKELVVKWEKHKTNQRGSWRKSNLLRWTEKFRWLWIF